MITDVKPEGFIPVLKVSGGLFLCDGKVLLIKRSPDKEFGANQWAIVGGKVNADETSSEALIREAQEETHITIEPKWIKKNKIYYHIPESNPEYTLLYELFLVEVMKRPDVTLNEENVEYGWFSLDEVQNLDCIEDAQYCISDILS